jgi:hypothetical protein
MKFRQLIFAILLFFLYGCSEEYDLALDESENSIVIEALVTNDTLPNYVRVTKGSTSLKIDFNSDGTPKAEAVLGALVIISDDAGNIDTLSESNHWYMKSKYGYYQTNSLNAKSGHSYYLYVKVDGVEYKAEAYMPDVVPIDSIYCKSIKLNENPPVLFFNEPANEKNYYLFDFPDMYGAWMFTLVDDRFLSSNIQETGFILSDGENPKWWKNNLFDVQNYLMSGDSVLTVSMSSLTQESYEYLSSLNIQFNSDGGVYSPSPTSAKGNISNGALGYFRASSVSRISIKLD